MLKKKCFAALSGILLAITVIAPFSFVDLYASSTPYQHNGYFYTFTTEGGNKCVIDWYWWSEAPSTTANGSYIKFRVNTYFAIPATSTMYEYGLIDQDGGVTEQMVDWYSSGGAYSPEFKIQVINCSYFHFRIIVSATSFWNNSTMANPNNYLNITTDQGTQTVSMSAQGNTSYWLKQIYNDVHSILTNGSGGGSIDMNSVLQFLSDMSDNQITIIDNQETVIDKLDIIINSLTTQPNSDTQDVIDNNDQANQNAQDVIDDYDTLTSTFDSDFDDSQTEMTTIMQNTTLTQFTNAVVWFTQQLGFLYNSLGDMKILVAMPLILGIALFFIGRGNVIFREGKSTLTYQEITDLDTLETKERIIKNTSSRYSRRQQRKAQKWVDDNF